jgi:hypothetical protein
MRKTNTSMKSTLQENAQPARTVGDSFAIVSDPGSRQPTQAMTHSAAKKNAASASAVNVDFLMRVSQSSVLSYIWSLTQEIANVHKKLLRELRIIAVQETANPTIAVHQCKACRMNRHAGRLS